MPSWYVPFLCLCQHLLTSVAWRVQGECLCVWLSGTRVFVTESSGVFSAGRDSRCLLCSPAGRAPTSLRLSRRVERHCRTFSWALWLTDAEDFVVVLLVHVNSRRLFLSRVGMIFSSFFFAVIYLSVFYIRWQVRECESKHVSVGWTYIIQQATSVLLTNAGWEQGYICYALKISMVFFLYIFSQQSRRLER